MACCGAASIAGVGQLRTFGVPEESSIERLLVVPIADLVFPKTVFVIEMDIRFSQIVTDLQGEKYRVIEVNPT